MNDEPGTSLAGTPPTQGQPPGTQLPPTTPLPTDGKPPAEAKPGEVKPEPKPGDAAPLSAADIKLPEGFTVDQPAMDSFLKVMNDAALTPQARTQQLIDLQTNLMKQVSEKGNELQLKAWTDMQDEWQTQTKADPEIGGAKWPETSAGISRLIATHAPAGKEAELRQAFDVTGAGNHPLIVKFLANVSKKLVAEGSPVQGQPTTQPRSQADIMFPNQGQK